MSNEDLLAELDAIEREESQPAYYRHLAARCAAALREPTQAQRDALQEVLDGKREVHVSRDHGSGHGR